MYFNAKNTFFILVIILLIVNTNSYNFFGLFGTNNNESVNSNKSSNKKMKSFLKQKPEVKQDSLIEMKWKKIQDERELANYEVERELAMAELAI